MLITIHNARSLPCRDATRSQAAACVSRTATATWSPYRRPGISWCCPTIGPFESYVAGAAAGCCCAAGGQGGRGSRQFTHHFTQTFHAPWLRTGSHRWFASQAANLSPYERNHTNQTVKTNGAQFRYAILSAHHRGWYEGRVRILGLVLEGPRSFRTSTHAMT